MYKGLEDIVNETLLQYGRGNLESEACRKKIAKEIAEKYIMERRVSDDRFSPNPNTNPSDSWSK